MAGMLDFLMGFKPNFDVDLRVDPTHVSGFG